MCDVSGVVCAKPEDHPDLFRQRRRRIRAAYGRNAVLDILPDELPAVLTALRMILGPPTGGRAPGGMIWMREAIMLCSGRRQVRVSGYFGPKTDAIFRLLWKMVEPTDQDNVYYAEASR